MWVIKLTCSSSENLMDNVVGPFTSKDQAWEFAEKWLGAVNFVIWELTEHPQKEAPPEIEESQYVVVELGRHYDGGVYSVRGPFSEEEARRFAKQPGYNGMIKELRP